MPTYEQIYQDTLARFGMNKTAARAPVNWLSRMWAKHGPSWSGAKEFAFGDPGGFVRDPIKSIRESFELPKKVPGKVPWGRYLQGGLMWGYPGYQALQIMRGPEGSRAEDVGGLAAGTLLGNALWKPFGILGAVGASEVGDRLGRKLVKPFVPKTQAPPPMDYPYGM